jgi:hypothetical protein
MPLFISGLDTHWRFDERHVWNYQKLNKLLPQTHANGIYTAEKLKYRRTGSPNWQLTLLASKSSGEAFLCWPPLLPFNLTQVLKLLKPPGTTKT